jgi:hypothetical protein
MNHILQNFQNDQFTSIFGLMADGWLLAHLNVISAVTSGRRREGREEARW